MKENSPLMKTERDQRFNSDCERETQKESQCKGLFGYLAFKNFVDLFSRWCTQLYSHICHSRLKLQKKV